MYTAVTAVFVKVFFPLFLRLEQRKVKIHVPSVIMINELPPILNMAGYNKLGLLSG